MLTNISGFTELLPKEQIAFNKVLEKIKAQFELHGFIPLDTPAVERVSTLNPLSTQMKYASKKGFKFAIILPMN